MTRSLDYYRRLEEEERNQTASGLVAELKNWTGPIFAQVSIGEGDTLFIKVYKNDAITQYKGMGPTMHVKYTTEDGTLVLG